MFNQLITTIHPLVYISMYIFPKKQFNFMYENECMRLSFWSQKLNLSISFPAPPHTGTEI